MNQNDNGQDLILTDNNNLYGNIDFSPYDKVFVLVDRNTKEYCLPILRSQNVFPINNIIVVGPNGESRKSLNSCEKIWDVLTQNRATRHSLLVVVGGGLLCDVGAFAASLYKRGMDYVLMPTTLLAQVDASLGGKTGVNFQNLKNQIGLFSKPETIIVNPDFLLTLSLRELRSGYAEMIKHGLIADYSYFERLSALTEISTTTLTKYILRSIEIKSEFVAADPIEQGIRKGLNFGHTMGHAFESLSFSTQAKGTLSHGEAIAIGMVCETFISSTIFNINSSLLEEVVQTVEKVVSIQNITIPEYAEIADLLYQDKKNRSGELRMSLLKKPGEVTFDVAVTREQVMDSLTYLAELKKIR